MKLGELKRALEKFDRKHRFLIGFEICSVNQGGGIELWPALDITAGKMLEDVQEILACKITVSPDQIVYMVDNLEGRIELSKELIDLLANFGALHDLAVMGVSVYEVTKQLLDAQNKERTG